MRASIACALLLIAGCNAGSRPSGGGGGFACPTGMNGILLIDWTVHGSLPSTQSCSGIANITLFLDNPLCGDIQIEPIACALDKFRYDEMPEGDAEVTLRGVDTQGKVMLMGSAPITLTKTLPAKPTTVPLQ